MALGGGRRFPIRLSLEDAEAVRRDLEKLGKDGQDSLQRIERAGAGPTNALRALNGAAATTRNVLLGIGAATATLGLLARQAAQAAERVGAIADQAEKLDADPEFLQGLIFGFEQTGVSASATEVGLQRLQRRMGELANFGKGTARDAFDALGISVTGSEGRLKSLEEILPEVADAMAQVTDQGKRLSITQKLVDSEGVGMAIALSKGGDALRQMVADAREAGVVLDESIVARADQSSDELERISRVIETQLAGALILATPLIVAAGERVADFVRDLGTLADLIDKRFGDQSVFEQLADNYDQIVALEEKIAGFGERRSPVRSVFEAQLEEAQRRREELQERARRQQRADLEGERQAQAEKDAEAERRQTQQRDAVRQNIELLREEVELESLAKTEKDRRLETEKALAKFREDNPQATAEELTQAEELIRLRFAMADATALRARIEEDLQKAIEDSIEQRGDELKAIEESKKAVAEQIRGIEDETRVLGLSSEERAVELELIEARNTALKAGRDLTDEEAAAIAKATRERFQANRREEAREEAARDAERQAEREAELMAEPFKNALSGIQSAFSDAFRDIFRGGVRSFRDLADAGRSILIDLAAELATVAVLRPLVGGGLNAVGLGNMGTQMGLGAAGGGGAGGAGAGGGFGLGAGDAFSLGRLLSGGSFIGAETQASIGNFFLQNGFGLETSRAAINGIGAAPWGIVGSIGASALGLNSGKPLPDFLLGTAGSVAGGAAGSAALGTALGSAAGPVGAIVGAFLGTALSGLAFGGSQTKPRADTKIQLDPVFDPGTDFVGFDPARDEVVVNALRKMMGADVDLSGRRYLPGKAGTQFEQLAARRRQLGSISYPTGAQWAEIDQIERDLAALFGQSTTTLPDVNPSPTAGQLRVGRTDSEGGGDGNLTRTIAGSVVNTVNGILEEIGGRLNFGDPRNPQGVIAGNIGVFKGNLEFEAQGAGRIFRGSGGTPQEAASALVLTLLKSGFVEGVSGEVATALANSAAGTLDELAADLDFAQGLSKALGELDRLGGALGEIERQAEAATDQLQAQLTAERDRAQALGLEAEFLQVTEAELRRMFEQLDPQEITQAERALAQIRGQFTGLSEIVQQLGLDISAAELAGFRDDAISALVSGFDEGIARQIRQITDPAQAELDALAEAQERRLEEARALGADLVEVEQLNALERTALLERQNEAALQAAEQQARALEQLTAEIGEDLLGLRLGDLSALSQADKLEAARTAFAEAEVAARGGDRDAVAALGTRASQLLGAARTSFASSPDFVVEFDRVTGALEDVGALVGGGGFAGLDQGDVVAAVDSQTVQLINRLDTLQGEIVNLRREVAAGNLQSQFA